MPRERKPNLPRIRYDRDELRAVLMRNGVSNASYLLDVYEHQRVEGKDLPCQSIVHHGPGHQSTTYCQVRGGTDGHDKRDGALLHYADLPSGGYAEWTDDNTFVEYWG